MRHLGSRASALIDGQLTGRRLRVAQAHLRRCAECRALVQAEAEIAERLHALGDVGVPVPPMPAVPPRPEPCSRLRRAARTVQDRTAMPAWRHRMARRAAVAGGLSVVIVGSVIGVGASREVSLDGAVLLTSPAAFTTAQPVLPASSADWWIVPDGLPEGFAVAAVAARSVDGRDVVQVDVVGPGGAARPVQVRGVVPAASVPAGAVSVQCGDVGVVVSGDAAVRDAVVARLPAHGLDASPVGRWERGLEALVSFVQEVVR